MAAGARGEAPVKRARAFPIIFTLMASLAFGGLTNRCDAQAATPIESTVSGMTSIPEKHFLVKLELDGKELLLNLQVKNTTARCVNSSDPEFKAMQGSIRRTQNGVFLVVLRNESRTLSQLWIFRKDGSAAIREVPDRGELQSAVPVEGDSLEPPKKP